MSTAIATPRPIDTLKVALAAPKMTRVPKRIREHVAHRNRLLYQRLPEAVRARDQQSAVTLWHEAMTTCYACHQGADPIPRLRKFNPTESVHSGHQWVAAKFRNLQSCEACHHGSTQVRGYD